MELLFCDIELFAGHFAPRHTAFMIRDMAVFSWTVMFRESVYFKEKTPVVLKYPVEQLNRMREEAADFVVTHKISSFFFFKRAVFRCRSPPVFKKFT